MASSRGEAEARERRERSVWTAGEGGRGGGGEGGEEEDGRMMGGKEGRRTGSHALESRCRGEGKSQFPGWSDGQAHTRGAQIAHRSVPRIPPLVCSPASQSQGDERAVRCLQARPRAFALVHGLVYCRHRSRRVEGWVGGSAGRHAGVSVCCTSVFCPSAYCTSVYCSSVHCSFVRCTSVSLGSGVAGCVILKMELTSVELPRRTWQGEGGEGGGERRSEGMGG